MNKPAIHRHTGNSKAGRRIAAANSLRSSAISELTQEQKDWNARVDAKKAAKKVTK
jgi:hypothetical protein